MVLAVSANYVRAMSRGTATAGSCTLCDASIACTYMMLAAHALGLASCWTGAFDDEDVTTRPRFPPHIRPVCLLAIGPGEQTSGMTPRLPIEEHVHVEAW